MMKRNHRMLTVLFLAFFIAESVLSINVYAAAEKDYTIEECWWHEDGTGRILAEWEKPESSTSYRLTVYKSGSSKKLLNKTVGNVSNNVSSVIAEKGTGSYYFTVTPIKGGSEYQIRSEELDVDSDYLKLIKEFVKKNTAAQGSSQGTQTAAPQGSSLGPGVAASDAYRTIIGRDPAAGNTYDGWSFDGKNWTYTEQGGSLARSAWIYDAGFWYAVDGNGNMQTGWNWIKGSDGISRCYYLSEASLGTHPLGAMFADAKTPDGYTVNADGAWVLNGAVQTH